MPLNAADPLQHALALKRRDGACGGARGRVLAQGEGWRALDVVCTAGPDDRAFEERHAFASISVVLAGAFTYRAARGEVLLTAGAILLGDAGRCFTCGHDHSEGDRCISFQFAPAQFERMAADLGLRRAAFRRMRLPPSRSSAALLARVGGSDRGMALEQAAIDAAAFGLRADADASAPKLSARDLARAVDAARRIELHPQEPHTIAALAAGAGLSPFRFLRAFTAAIGVSPHQFLLRRRLLSAARRLRETKEPVTAIAFAAGFGDLSNFTRTFRREFGVTPRAWQSGK